MSTKGVPFVKKRVVHNLWQISFYEEFEFILFPEGQLHNEIDQLINLIANKNLGAGFRREIILSGFPFLCAIKPEEKSIYIGTRRLSRELALLKLHEVNSVEIDQDIDKLFFTLKDHVEKISSLSPVNFPRKSQNFLK